MRDQYLSNVVSSPIPVRTPDNTSSLNNNVDIVSFAPGTGWAAKDAPVGLQIIHKPANIIVTKNVDSTLTATAPTYVTDKFILQSFQESRNEKVQVIETFGKAASLAFFDEKVKVYAMTGVFVEANNTQGNTSYKWASIFKEFYDTILRGTKLVQNGQIAVLAVQDNMIYFYPINLNMQTAANSPYTVSFTMSIIVTKHLNSNASRDLMNNLSKPSDFITVQFDDKIKSTLLSPRDDDLAALVNETEQTKKDNLRAEIRAYDNAINSANARKFDTIIRYAKVTDMSSDLQTAIVQEISSFFKEVLATFDKEKPKAK